MPGCESCISGTSANSADGTTTTYGACGSADGIVWFTFTAQDAQNTFTLTPGTLQNPIIIISTQPCGSGVFNTCNSGTGSATITASWGMSPGEQGWIGVGSTSGSDGTFNLCIESVPPTPGPGNTCNTANVICETTGFAVPMACAGGSGQTPGCFGSAPQQDTWITFTVLQNGTIAWTGDPNANAEYDWALWNVTNGCPGTVVSCNYNYAGQCGSNFGMGTAGGEFNGTINATAGQTYAIQIDNFSQNGVGFDFTWQGTAVITPVAGFTMSNNFSCTGSLTVNFTHTGVGSATYNFGNGNTYTGTNPPNQTYGPGTYSISATASSANCSDVFSNFITVYSPLAGVINSTPSLCNAPCTGSASVSNVTGGDGIYTYLWSNGATGTSINNLCPGNYSVTISNATCGTSLVLNVTVAVEDTQPPTGTAPASVTVQCIGNIPPVNTGSVTAVSDNLDPNPVVTHVGDVSNGGTCPQIITRTYRITDHCGLFTDVIQTITINDDIPPVFAAPPANVTVQCIGNVPPMTNLNWTDNCDGSGSVAGIDGALIGGTCGGTIIRTWTRTDACGNTGTATQTITINDNIPPVFSAPPANITVQCIGDVPAMTSLNWTDNCDGAGSVTGTDAALVGGTCGGTITRTWTYIDACGNAASVNQTITINDNIAPVFSAPPANITVQCIGDVPAMTSLNWTDNCDGAGSVSGTDASIAGGPCGGTITRTWTYTDACGNTSSVSQTFTIDDTTAPTASNLPEVNITDPADYPPVNINDVTDAADNCTVNPTVEWVSDVSDGGLCPETVTRTYSVTDDCGNSILVTQLILIGNGGTPTASDPDPIFVQCINDVPTPDPAVVTDALNDDGTPATVDWENDSSDGNLCPQVITRTYRVTNDCAVSIFVEQIITVNDDTAPVGTAPAAVAVQCPTDVPAPDIAGVTGVSDNCTANPLVEHVDDVSDGNTCPEVITRTYRITDDCDNFTEVTQTITINDDIAPVGTAPAAITVECIGDVPLADITGVTGVSDNCTLAPVVAFVSDVSDDNTCAEVITRTYSITDECGNVTLVTQTITIDDTTDPTASNPADIIAPGGPAPAPDPAVVTDAADNCTANPVVEWVSDSSDGAPCPETITRIYSVTDDCGNQITVTQLILITDPFPPTASNPAPVAVQCIGDVPTPDPAVVTDADDNNGVPVVTWEDDTSNGQTCPEIITRRYRVTDDCGNFIFVEQLITVNDDINPLGTAPADITVVCQTDVPAPNITSVTGVSDNCTVNPLVQHVSDVSDNNVCNGEIITRTYSITDDCGNSITVTQLITISAVTPTFTLASSNPTTCGGTDGSITFSGLNPNQGYQFSYNGNAVATITTNANGQYVLGGLPAGSYTSFQFYPPPCPLCSFTNNTVINLVDPNAPVIDAGPNQTVCEGTQVTLTASNPNGAAITWNNGVNDGVAFTSPVGTTQYVVTANLNNCISTDAVSITVNPIPLVNAGPDLVICEGEFITLNGSGAQSYTWDNGVVNGQTFSPAQTTTYTVTGNSLGCTATDQLTVTVNLQPQVSFTASDQTGCIPVTVDFNNTTTNVNSDQCSWSIGNLAVLTGCEQTFTFTQAGCYNITLQVTSDDGCVGSTTYQNFVCVDDYPVANFGITPLFLTTLNNQATFLNGSIGAATYEWEFGDGNTSNAENPTHTYFSEEENSYIIQLIAYSTLGCPDTAYAVIDMRDELIFYVPNTFTPDGDNYNETFLPIFTSGFDPYDFNLLIFNRWGEVLFESNNHLVGWDGTYGGNIVKDGTYIWKIEFKTKYTDERKVHHGHVNILR
jgi:gliding motility-associated-like protein